MNDSRSDFERALRTAKLDYTLKGLDTWMAVGSELFASKTKLETLLKTTRLVLRLVGFDLNLTLKEYERLKGREFAYIMHADKIFT